MVDTGRQNSGGWRHSHAEVGGRSLGGEVAASHLGEAGLEAPRGVAGVRGHPLGGLMVLGELQGGSRFMTRRPQAAMLRFIWEARRKSWPGAKGRLRPGGPLTPHPLPPARPSWPYPCV